MANYSQNLRFFGVYFILTLLLLLPIISYEPLPTSNPKLRNSSQTNQLFRFRTNLETLNRDLVWNRTYNFSPYDRGYAIVECQTGGFALFGETEDMQSQTDLLLIRVDATGNVIWNSTFGIIGNEYGADFVECLDGGFVLLGNRGSEMFLVRTDSMGRLQWHQSFFSSPVPRGTSIVRCQTGGFAVLCSSDYDQTMLLRLDNEGVPLWNRTFDRQPYQSCDVFVECLDGGFAFIGTYFYIGPNDVMLFRTDIEGNLLWNQTIDTGSYVRGVGLIECEDGGFALTGMLRDFTIFEDYIFLGRTDHLGVLMWNNTYGDGWGNSVLQLDSGEFVITGSIVGRIASYGDVVFFVVDYSGHILVYWMIGGAYSQIGKSIIECRDGGFAIIGETYDETDFSNVLLIRIPGEARPDSFQKLQWYSVVIVLPILVSAITVILTIWVFRSKKISSHKKKIS